MYRSWLPLCWDYVSEPYIQCEIAFYLEERDIKYAESLGFLKKKSFEFILSWWCSSSKHPFCVEENQEEQNISVFCLNGSSICSPKSHIKDSLLLLWCVTEKLWKVRESNSEQNLIFFVPESEIGNICIHILTNISICFVIFWHIWECQNVNKIIFSSKLNSTMVSICLWLKFNSTSGDSLFSPFTEPCMTFVPYIRRNNQTNFTGIRIWVLF